MTHEFKSGDYAMVKIIKVDTTYALIECKKVPDQPDYDIICWDCLLPLPMLDPHANLKASVVEAAVALRQRNLETTVGVSDVVERADLRIATDEYIAAKTPPDPIKELRSAWKALPVDYRTYNAEILRLEEAIAAIERSQKE